MTRLRQGEAGQPLRRVLIANRGEIARRIIRACRELGIETVAVYSDADANALHVVEGDAAVRIGPAPSRESYLNINAIIDAAKAANADAIHPGYGFLSERAPFAIACEKAGLTFVGPPASALEKMGSKTGARKLMVAAGVPVVPGDTPSDQSDEALSAAADRVGSPVLIKPAAGGGGIGMKTVRDKAAVSAVPLDPDDDVRVGPDGRRVELRHRDERIVGRRQDHRRYPDAIDDANSTSLVVVIGGAVEAVEGRRVDIVEPPNRPHGTERR